MLSDCIGEQVAIPDNESAQVKVTVTGELFHPAAFGAGETVAEIVGAVLSMLMLRVALALLPATSETVPVTF